VTMPKEITAMQHSGQKKGLYIEPIFEKNVSWLLRELFTCEAVKIHFENE